MTDPSQTPRSSADWELLAELFAEAVLLDEAERVRLLDERCAGRPGLRWELEAMLAASAEEEALELESRVLVRDEAPTPAGGRLGPYRLLRLLARGGMGEVHLAERVDGDYSQLVAVKLLRPGLESTDVLERFRLERDLLARLTHPAVVPLLDGGTAPDGRPYLVLQYVDGRPITEHCAARSLDLPARGRLFVSLCRAVQYAHSNLVVHRDLKPSNILVTPEGEIRLLDFGIAKLLSEDRSGRETTQAPLAPMTPRRAAPEQVRGEPASTATDVWALGLLLHELAAGELPETGPGEPLAAGVSRRLDRDLAAIVGKALSEEPTRRYPSAGQLGDDVERRLAGQPVGARPDSWGYRARRFVGRHRAAVTGGLAALLALLALVAVSTLQSRRVARERDHAAAEEAKADAVVDLLVQLFAGTDPNQGARGDTVRISDLLARGEGKAAELGGQPDVQARLRQALGRIYLERSEFSRALELLGAARDAELERLGAGDPRTLPVRLDYSRALHASGRLEEARSEVREALDLLLADPERDPLVEARARLALGSLLRGGEAEGEVGRAIDLLRADPRADPVEIASALTVLATHKRFAGDEAATEALFREALELARPPLGPEHPFVLALRSNLTEFLKEPAARVTENRDLLEIRRRLYGDRSHLVANTWNLLGLALVDSGELEEAATAFREAYSIWSASAGPANGKALVCLHNLARCLEWSGLDTDAGYAYERLAHDLVGARIDPRTAAGYRLDIAAFDLRRGRLDAAEDAARQLLAELDGGGRGVTRLPARARALLGGVELDRGRPERAAELLAAAHGELAGAGAELEAAQVGALLGRALLAAGRAEEAVSPLESALQVLETSPRCRPDARSAAAAALAEARTAAGAQG